MARRARVPRGWGLEVGTLGTAFGHAGFEGTAQVDLGQHEHDHRSVGGPDGLGDMCREVAVALLQVLGDNGVDPDYGTLPDRYRETAAGLIEQYAADAAFNGLEYDRAGERDQVEAYAESIEPPGSDTRLPAWTEAPVDPGEIERLAREGLADALE